MERERNLLRLRAIFDGMDSDRDGVVTYSDLELMYRKTQVAIKPEKLEEIVGALTQTSPSGTITFAHLSKCFEAGVLSNMFRRANVFKDTSTRTDSVVLDTLDSDLYAVPVIAGTVPVLKHLFRVKLRAMIGDRPELFVMKDSTDNEIADVHFLLYESVVECVLDAPKFIFDSDWKQTMQTLETDAANFHRVKNVPNALAPTSDVGVRPESDKQFGQELDAPTQAVRAEPAPEKVQESALAQTPPTQPPIQSESEGAASHQNNQQTPQQTQQTPQQQTPQQAPRPEPPQSQSQSQHLQHDNEMDSASLNSPTLESKAVPETTPVAATEKGGPQTPQAAPQEEASGASASPRSSELPSAAVSDQEQEADEQELAQDDFAEDSVLEMGPSQRELRLEQSLEEALDQLEQLRADHDALLRQLSVGIVLQRC